MEKARILPDAGSGGKLATLLVPRVSERRLRVANAPPAVALFAASGAMTPSYSPFPKFDLFGEEIIYEETETEKETVEKPPQFDLF